MAVHRIVAAVVVIGAVAPAPAQGTLTPEGPATVRDRWFGPVAAMLPGPQVAVSWSVTVGPGGNAGPVRLRVMEGAKGTVVGSGPLEWLPAVPGTYQFVLNPGIRYGGSDLALDQQVGGHAIVNTHAPRPERGPSDDPARLYALDVFRPPLADGARDVDYSERRTGEELLLRPKLEPDGDLDRLGDVTQDIGDLRMLKASVSEEPRGGWLLRARVRNVGGTVRHRPHLRTSLRALSRCERREDWWWSWCAGPPLMPGATANLAVRIRAGRGRIPALVKVGAEGPDTRISDNARALPRVRLRAIRGTLRASLASSRPGRATVSVRVAGVRLARVVRFTAPGRRTVSLQPARRHDRLRLATALRDRRPLTAMLTAKTRNARTSLRVKL